MNLTLLTGAILGLISVAFGAYAEHGLKASLSAEQFHSVASAVRYNELYALLISAIGIACFLNLPPAISKHLFRAGLVFVLGTLLFSFSIYGSTVFGMPMLTRAAPIGGTTLMIGWVYLGCIALCFKAQGQTPAP
jgi:uncharacterized membrane protein YgdD (TMEM256/DUF423 family)